MKNIPRIPFSNLPTPLEELTNLSSYLGGPRIFVKRDDLTGLGLGGNKVRKLEFLVADALSLGSRTLITSGALQSNHCRQTAAAAAKCGLHCYLILSGSQNELQIHDISGNLFLDRLFGAEIIPTSLEQREKKVEDVFNRSQKNNERPYFIPYGGSNPLGATAYIFALNEITSQDFEPDWIIHASSSGGTQAGLELGKRILNLKSKILGISVDEPSQILKKKIADLASTTANYLEEKIFISPDEINVNADYLGKGYGIIGQQEIDAINLFARQEGLLLDPVYTGRVAAGLIDLIKKDYFHSSEKILFWHTGGIPALFANRYTPTLFDTR